MMSALIGGLLRLVVGVTVQTTVFKSELKGLEATLKSVEEIVDDIVKLDGELNVVTKKLTVLLREGNELVLKCSEIEGLKSIMRPLHSNKLIKFTDSLLKFFQIDVQALLIRDNKNIRVQTAKLDAKVDGLDGKWDARFDELVAKLNELVGPSKMKANEAGSSKIYADNDLDTGKTEVKSDSDGCEMTVINSMKKGWATVSGNVDPNELPNQERLSRFLTISLTINILSGKNLVVRDKYWKKSSDPYVIVQMGKQKVETKVVKKNVNPEWNEALTLSVTDTSLPIELKVYDKDTFSRDDKMGDAKINIGPFIKAVKMQLESSQSRTTITEVKPSRDNCLDEESCIFGCDGKVVQYMLLKLQNVERGLVDLQLHWMDTLYM